ncbi:hypothetical protein BDA99DRAFT_516620 [Phascolomyces articulosus]|uniref:PH domain-containing protein n=1 Tax=Phascolomyces articulosus TaxID=60185 RepID=A0AAD5JVH0_9FUNG|nr:hypothetical protein BDA99DRAFT_516620 [Phascolomyces articulosus]
MDTTSAWEPDTKNYLVVKKYKYRDSLMADSVLQKRYPPNYGWLSIEYKKGRWQRRFFYIMDNAIHHAKDNKGTGSTPLCHLSAFDVYTMLHHVRGSPTEFVFAIRAQDKPHIFERPEDFMHLLAADDYDALRQWVLSIRCAKNMFHYQLFPHRVINPLGPIDAPASTTPAVPMDGSLRENRGTSSNGGKETALASRSNTLRRHKSTKELSRSIPSFNGNEETIKSNGGLSRHGSRRGPVGREGGTLLGNSENEPIENSPRHSPIPPSPQPTSVSADDSQPQTLIQIDDKVKFSKGSLLDKSVHGGVGNAMHGGGETTRLSRSRSTREPHHNHSSSGGGSSASGGNEAPSSSTGGGETRRQMSVRRKPTTSRAGRRPEIPVMPSAPAPGSGPLLQQEEDPEQAHTRRLMERQIKPLVNFNEPSSGFSPNRRY